MKIRKPTTHLVDIGNLDHAVRLPMASRIRNGMKSTCAACSKSITDEFFVAGFKTGLPNMLIHEGCADKSDPAVAKLYVAPGVEATR